MRMERRAGAEIGDRWWAWAQGLREDRQVRAGGGGDFLHEAMSRIQVSAHPTPTMSFLGLMSPPRAHPGPSSWIEEHEQAAHVQTQGLRVSEEEGAAE